MRLIFLLKRTDLLHEEMTIVSLGFMKNSTPQTPYNTYSSYFATLEYTN